MQGSCSGCSRILLQLQTSRTIIESDGDENTTCSRDVVGLGNSFCFRLPLDRRSTRAIAETNTAEALCRSRLRIQCLGASAGCSHVHLRLFRELSRWGEIDLRSTRPCVHPPLLAVLSPQRIRPRFLFNR
jgi:hypothetical protein